ncbi:methylated-DNA--[protein]-cysteine S-methyltransferase [Gymnodinialimonas sp. 2305UL16-5]|uniref:methylated-DNA--[protein]-cysteine S-methyltransferase n=1 Tax=Gymnodinialimonas mytili TaxID=3126503 RepID=UPI0030AA0C2D
MEQRISVDTPLGPVYLEEADGAIVKSGWRKVDAAADTPLLREAASELVAYFDGQLTEFSVPIRHGRNDATGAVWNAMRAIPLGDTRTYGDVATEVGIPAQAVGQACGANNIPILIPCHRILGTGHLGGFSAPQGIEAKVWLLRHEGAAGLLI